MELKISSSHVRYINMCLWCCCIPQTAEMPAKWARDWFGAEGSNPPQSVLTEECLWKWSELTEAASVAVDLSMRLFWWHHWRSKKDNANFKSTTLLLSSGQMSEMFLFYRNASKERSCFNSEGLNKQTDIAWDQILVIFEAKLRQFSKVTPGFMSADECEKTKKININAVPVI